MAAENGGKVVIVDMQAEAGESSQGTAGGRYAKADVNFGGRGQGGVALAVKEFGGVHVLVNCAGIAVAEAPSAKDAPHSLGSFSKVVGVNLIGSLQHDPASLRTAMAKGVRRTAPAGAPRDRPNTASSPLRRADRPGRLNSLRRAGGGMTLPIAARSVAHGNPRLRIPIAPGLFETPMLKGLPKEAQGVARQGRCRFRSRLGRPTNMRSW